MLCDAIIKVIKLCTHKDTYNKLYFYNLHLYQISIYYYKFRGAD